MEYSQDPDSPKWKWHHIGLLADDGFVIQAEEAVNGVHDDERYVPGNWTARGRLDGSLLPGK
jgi:hypothetical protein